MGMAKTYKQLRAMSDADLITNHDEVSKHTSVGLNYYLEEIYRRSQQRQADLMLRYARFMLIFTIVITVLTLLNVAIFVMDKWM